MSITLKLFTIIAKKQWPAVTKQNVNYQLKITILENSINILIQLMKMMNCRNKLISFNLKIKS